MSQFWSEKQAQITREQVEKAIVGCPSKSDRNGAAQEAGQVGSHLRGDRVLRSVALGLRSARRSDPTKLKPKYRSREVVLVLVVVGRILTVTLREQNNCQED